MFTNTSSVMNYPIIIILGLIVGSFLNVIILRFDDLKSVLTGRSHCPSCNRNLIWYELIPVLSYIALRGRCRTCQKSISLQYPLVEAGTALVFSLLFWKFGLTFQFAILSLISCILMVVFVYDIIHQEVSDILVYAAAALWLIYLAFNYFFILHSTSLIINSFYGALALGGFFACLVAISQERWMGKGDIGLGALIGFILAWPNVLVGAFLAFIIGSIGGISLVLIRSLKFKSQVPFAPFLILGFWLALLWGGQILSWYTNLIL